MAGVMSSEQDFIGDIDNIYRKNTYESRTSRTRFAISCHIDVANSYLRIVAANAMYLGCTEMMHISLFSA